MDWRNIPSLAALKALEAAHRTGSYSAAARELNVTHAAIAQHIRKLEEFFGTPLMMRDGKGMRVTDAGERLVGPVQEGFLRISEGVAALNAAQSDKPLTLAVTPAFAENWLMPRLNGYWSQYPDIPLSIQPGYELVDFRSTEVDLAIRYGLGNWDGLDATRLVSASSMVVANPDLIAREKLLEPENLQKQTWILEEGYREERMWLHSQRIEVPEDRIRLLPTYGMVISALRDGAGVGVLSRAVAEQDIREGRLVALREGGDTKLAYWILTRNTVLPDRVKTVRDWLLSVA